MECNGIKCHLSLFFSKNVSPVNRYASWHSALKTFCICCKLQISSLHLLLSTIYLNYISINLISMLCFRRYTCLCSLFEFSFRKYILYHTNTPVKLGNNMIFFVFSKNIIISLCVGVPCVNC